MRASPHASIVITCYNYGRFLRHSIDSALRQTCPGTEVIVVDDGSTDESAEVIAGYGGRIVAVARPHRGQAAAFNAGFAASRGEVVCFLDADDALEPEALEAAWERLAEPGTSKVHWPLWIMDESGRRTCALHPDEPLAEGDLRAEVVERGWEGYVWPVTSGNAWSRAFLERALPIPEREYGTGAAESYLAALAPAFGPVRRIPKPLGAYRMHAESASNRRPVADLIRRQEAHRAALGGAFRAFGLEVDPDRWPPPREVRQAILLACEELEALIPPGRAFVFVEWNQWGPGQILRGRRAIPFLERDGQYWGRPESDTAAVVELERLREAGAGYLVVGFPAFWWLQHYEGLDRHLRSRYTPMLENERLVVFDLSARR
jgi:glycosyltransferase involved in cell wall biosynthesis